MFKRILFFILLFVVQLGFSQQRSRADRFFDKGDYLNAAKYYEIQLESSYHKRDIENIAISYYNIFEYREASYYLKELVKGRFDDEDKMYDNNFNFMLFQVQSALGNYENGLIYLKRYKENTGNSLDNDISIAKIEEIRLKNPDYTIKKTNFNSENSDFGAVKLGDTVYFTSDRPQKNLFRRSYKWTHQSFLDIYKVKVNKQLDTVGNIRCLPDVINSKLHEGNFCFSKEGNTLYVSRSNYLNGKKKFDTINKTNNIHIFKSVKKEGKWSTLEKISFNELGYSYQHPALNPKGDKLYFSSNRKGGFGGFDIYYVPVFGDGYGDPVNLGKVINTAHREQFPFISNKGNLFFSSNGHFGLGMLDNFVSEFVKEKFTEPINLGVPINSKYDDFNLNYFSDKKGFFSSNRHYKSDDVFSFNQIGEVFVREYINTFEIRDYVTKEFVKNVQVELKDKHEKIVYTNTLDSIASFNLNLLTGNYSLKLKNENHINKVQMITALEKENQTHVLYLNKKIKVIAPPKKILNEDKVIEKQLDKKEIVKEDLPTITNRIKKTIIDEKLKETDPIRYKMLTDTVGPPIVDYNGKLYFELPPIYFDFGMWSISEPSKETLKELAEKLERYPSIDLKISSYTDSRGTERYNQILSERRAEATRNYLALEVFINARRLKFKGFGEMQPAIRCKIPSFCTEAEHQLNRRSEFKILKY